MSLLVRPVDITLSRLISSTVSDSSTIWTYNIVAAIGSVYLDPVTRRLYKAKAAGRPTSTITFDSFFDTVQWTAHGRSDGDVFSFSGGTAPTGLSPQTPYYMVNAAANTFQLALTPDGAPIDFTSDGSGTITGYINAPFDNPAAWQGRGPSNRWAMFDQSNQTITSFSGACQVVVSPGSRVDSITAMAMRNVSEIYIASAGTSTSRTNSALQSQTFENGSWTKTNASVTADAIRAPDGSMTADKLNGSATNGVHTIAQTIASVGAASVYVRAGELTKGWLATSGATVWFDLADGSITLQSGTPTSYGIQRVNNSPWYRVWIIGGGANMTIGMRDAAGADSFVGSAAQGFYIWGAQKETAAALTPYLATTTTAVTSTTHTHIEAYSLGDDAFANDWYASIYSEPVYRRDVATSTIPPYPSQSITVTLISPGTGEIGNLAFGLSKDIGKAEYSARTGTRDFSVKEVDDFGGITLTERGYAKRGNFTVSLKERRSDAVKTLIDQARATPMLWLMAPDDVEATGMQWKERGIFYGTPKNWDFQFWQPEDDKFDLEVEGFV